MSHLELPQLSFGQFQLITNSYGVTAKKTLLDVGCRDGAWGQKIGGGLVKGLDDSRSSKSTDAAWYGSPAASIPFEVHTSKCAVIRGTETFFGSTHPMEVTIALANILSCLAAGGSLVIPTDSPEDLPIWSDRLACFPVTLQKKTLKSSLFAKLTFGLLTNGIHELQVLEFKLGRKPISRLEWHRYAREGVLSKQGSTAA